MAWKSNFADDTEREKVSWNIAAAQAHHVSDLIATKDRYYLTGDLSNWLWTVSALRENINHDLSKDERIELDGMEKDAAKLSIYWERHRNMENKNNNYRKIRFHFSAAIRVYQRRVMDLLKQLGYFPSKEDRTELSF